MTQTEVSTDLDVTTEDAPVHRGSLSRWTSWGLALISFFLPLAAWALSTPQYGSPDEWSHVYRAAAVVRGEIVPAEGATGGGSGLLMVPKGFVDTAEQISCYAFRTGSTADCVTVSADDGTLVERESGAARYNPTYYFLVGWPSLFLPGGNGLFAMRLVSSLICAALLASAVLSLAHGRGGRTMLAGLVVATTPMVFFIGGMVNPNGVEIAAAISVWAGLLRLTTGPDGETGRLLRRVGIAGSLLVLSRGLSPLWLAIIVVACLLMANRRSIVPLFKRRDTWLWVGLVAASTAASIAWTVLSGASKIVDLYADPDRSLLGAMSYETRFLGKRLSEFVGVFGWTDTPSPAVALLVYAVVFGGLVFAVAAAARWRATIVIGALIGVVIVGSLVIEATQFNYLGLFWQSRYIMPVSVGVALVAAYALSQRFDQGLAALGRRPAAIVVLGMIVVQGLCFGQALIRNQSGLDLTLNPLAGPWHPEVGSVTVLGLETVGLLAIGALVLLLPVGPSTPPKETVSAEDRWFADPAAAESVAADKPSNGPTYSEPVYADNEYADKDLADEDETSTGEVPTDDQASAR